MIIRRHIFSRYFIKPSYKNYPTFKTTEALFDSLDGVSKKK
jgi:hypothetical protein